MSVDGTERTGKTTYQCLITEQERTLRLEGASSAFDPKRT